MSEYAFFVIIVVVAALVIGWLLAWSQRKKR